MRLRLLNGSSLELFVGSYDRQVLKFTNDEIQFKKITYDDRNVTLIPIQMKNPTMKVNGKVSFGKLTSNDPHDPNTPWIGNVPIQFDTNATLKFDHIDNPANNTLQSITYFNWIKFKDHIQSEEISRIPSENILRIPWQEAINSWANVLSLVAISILAAISLVIYKWRSLPQKSGNIDVRR
jgi:hypothetical protein